MTRVEKILMIVWLAMIPVIAVSWFSHTPAERASMTKFATDSIRISMEKFR